MTAEIPAHSIMKNNKYYICIIACHVGYLFREWLKNEQKNGDKFEERHLGRTGLIGDV